MVATEPRYIDWESAQIRDGALRVDLTGQSSKAWRARFEGLLALPEHPQSGWGKARVTKQAIKVADVQPGSESDLRHFLESIVLQANTDAAAEHPGGQDVDSEAQDEQANDSDQQMTRAFRSFASE